MRYIAVTTHLDESISLQGIAEKVFLLVCLRLRTRTRQTETNRRCWFVGIARPEHFKVCYDTSRLLGKTCMDIFQGRSLFLSMLPASVWFHGSIHTGSDYDTTDGTDVARSYTAKSQFTARTLARIKSSFFLTTTSCLLSPYFILGITLW